MTFMDARQVISALQHDDGLQLSVDELITILNLDGSRGLWTLERLDAVMDFTRDRKDKYSGLRMTQGGKAVRLSNTEDVAINAGPYKEIVEAISGSASNLSKIFSARNPKPYDVHILGKQAGHWSRPDILVAFHSRSADVEPSEIHSIEFEFPGRAWPENVAQAYASGRGARKSWLLFSLEDYPKTEDFRNANPEWLATEWLARDLGVGLIGYEQLSAASTWRRILKPRRRSIEHEQAKRLGALIETSVAGQLVSTSNE